MDSGADVNVKDEFSSADRVAFRERVSRLRGEEGEEKMRKGRGERGRKEGRRRREGVEGVFNTREQLLVDLPLLLIYHSSLPSSCVGEGQRVQLQNQPLCQLLRLHSTALRCGNGERGRRRDGTVPPGAWGRPYR